MATRRGAVVFGTAALAAATAGSAAHRVWLSHGEPTAPAPQLDPIPVFDLRESDPARHALVRREPAQSLAQACIGPLTPAARLALSGADALALRWLRGSGTPYVGELERIAAGMGIAGVHLLNTSYEWGCTSLAAPAPDGARRVSCARSTGPSTGSDAASNYGGRRVQPACSRISPGPAPWAS